MTDVAKYEALVQDSLAQIFAAEINVGFCTIYSPMPGIAGRRLIDVGNIITDAGTDLLVINQITPIYIDFSVPEKYFHEIQQARNNETIEIDVTVPYSNLITKATLEMINNTVDPDTGMILIRGVVENKTEEFWPEQFARVRLTLNEITDAIMVPKEAIQAGYQGDFVWVVEGNSVKSVLVTTGEQYMNNVQVLKGLKEDVVVVTEGQLGLKEGRQVQVKNNEGKQKGS